MLLSCWWLVTLLGSNPLGQKPQVLAENVLESGVVAREAQNWCLETVVIFKRAPEHNKSEVQFHHGALTKFNGQPNRLWFGEALYCIQFALPNYYYKMDMAGYILSLVLPECNHRIQRTLADDEQVTRWWFFNLYTVYHQKVMAKHRDVLVKMCLYCWNTPYHHWSWESRGQNYLPFGGCNFHGHSTWMSPELRING